MLLGLVCGDSQSYGAPIEAGVSVVLAGTLRVFGVSTARTYYVAPSGTNVCGYGLSSQVLPYGVGFDADDGASYHQFSTDLGFCF